MSSEVYVKKEDSAIKQIINNPNTRIMEVLDKTTSNNLDTTKSCSIQGCTKPIRIKKLGLCQMHETRLRSHGDPNHQRKTIRPQTCKIKDCTNLVYNKNNQLCIKHYQRFWKYGDPNHISKRKSLIPLRIPEGETIWNYQKAKQIIGIVSELEKMVMCGYVDNESSLSREARKLIGEQKYSKYWFYEKYVLPILMKNDSLVEHIVLGKKLSALVEDIIKNGGKTINNDQDLKLLNLGNIGIKRRDNEYSFNDSFEDIKEKYIKSNIEDSVDNGYEICHKLKIHYNRWDKITKGERV